MIKTTIKAGLAAALAMLASGPLAAQQSTQDAFTAAVGSLTRRLGPVESGPEIATTDAAANAADLAAIEQALDLFGEGDFPLNGFATFESVCEPLNRLSVRHVLDGAAALRRPADAAPPTPAEMQTFTAQLQTLQLQNAARYQDAMTVLTGGGLRCMVKHFPTLSAFLAGLPEAERTPIRIDGARKMRQGGAQTLIGFAMALRDPSTTPENRARLAAYLAEVADPLAAALTPELRTYVTASIDQLPATQDPEALATTALIKTAMATDTCESLCRY
ncbi:hypothetical protein [Porphyrobacter sp. YT40]|uniref:hypothetical protein n=1 Tax=Porphyrobacter sp. YT40 TaxID=2547601 RepID=UPI0011419ACB|nr:hypothetical protein [Porphyrobacter sp. YT40]QDH35929.1 hypothetical protein E2E27_17330 [Porphyrobacter sp. YT40]